MTRALTSGLRAEVLANKLSPVILVSFAFDSGELNAWTGVGQLMWNSKVFTGFAWLASIDAVIETGRLEANGSTFTLSGVPSALIAVALNEPYQGRAASMWLAALNQQFQLIADPYLLLKGAMDVMAIEEGGDTCAISLTVENSLISLERPNVRRYTPEDFKKLWPGDTFFDQVSTLQDKSVRFGR